MLLTMFDNVLAVRVSLFGSFCFVSFDWPRVWYCVWGGGWPRAVMARGAFVIFWVYCCVFDCVLTVCCPCIGRCLTMCRPHIGGHFVFFLFCHVVGLLCILCVCVCC